MSYELNRVVVITSVYNYKNQSQDLSFGFTLCYSNKYVVDLHSASAVDAIKQCLPCSWNILRFFLLCIDT